MGSSSAGVRKLVPGLLVYEPSMNAQPMENEPFA